jgi:excinuclease ABC subunit A
MTDPREHGDMLAALPDDVPGLVRVAQGVLIHPFCVKLYHVQLSPRQREEVFLRSVAQMLGRMREFDPTPLTVAREPSQQLVGNCRDHAVLCVALLRQQGIPARLRVGFASYLSESKNDDHWVTEYWDAERERWVLIDPQLDDVQRDAFKIDFDPLDMRFCNQFYTGGQAWQLCRSGQAKASQFGFKRWWGWGYIRGSLLHDLDALNKIELIAHDWWGELPTKNERDVAVEERELLDRLAGLSNDADERGSLNHFDEMREAYEALPYSRVVQSKLRLLGLTGEREIADPDDLRPSGAEWLAGLQGERYTLPQSLPEREGGDILPPGKGELEGGDFLGDIVIRGARQHNLKNIDVTIPRFKFVVVTGVSGSGKSSLAFDTLYAEGQRRYVESLSAYVRQFLDKMEKPDVDHMLGLSPTVAIEQKVLSRNPRSTVGTVTEVADYLRVLFARAGVPHCPQCGRGVQPQTARQITDQLVALAPGMCFWLLAPVVRERKGAHAGVLAQARRGGYARARVDGEMVDLSDGALPSLAKTKVHTIELVVDRLVVPGGDAVSAEHPEPVEGCGSAQIPVTLRHAPRQARGAPQGDSLLDSQALAEFRIRLADSVETALKAGEGQLVVVLEGGEEILLSEHNACPTCNVSFPTLKPRMFSFNSPAGMCPECNGLGVKLSVDPELVVTKPHLSLLDGASPWFGDSKGRDMRWWARPLLALGEHYGVDIEQPWDELPQSFRDVVLYGSGDERIHFAHQVERDDMSWSGEVRRPFRGAIYEIRRLFRQTRSEHRRRYYMQFMGDCPCPTCAGERLCPEARFVTVGDRRLPEVTGMTIAQAHAWVSDLSRHLTPSQLQIAGEVLKELRTRLQFMLNVGLHYLSLDRSAPSLSGGEGQRIRLSSQLGCGLVGILYILDEPSIGLHPRDHHALLDTLKHLRNAGNTVLVIEHDAATMRAADWLIDLGPGPGILGGEVVSVGAPEMVMADPDSLTGRYLSGELQVTPPNGQTRREPQGWLTVVGAQLHNLKRIDARFPLGVLTCVTGVSGSGKSSLVAQTLHPALSRALHGAHTVPGPHDHIDGLEQIDKVINITQSPIGRTPRSNPGTYVGALTEIRRVFAQTPEARARGYKAGRFSFNVKGGRCEACKGHGRKRVEMHFLPDVWVTCAECGGTRFNRQTLEVTYKGKSVADVLDMDVQEALAFFANHPKVVRILQTLRDVGLDYIKLGQSATTLSGGEAQRVKLAKELSRRDTGRTLYILDEPTTGLHFADIQKLLDVLHRLTDAGNTVVIIEHNLDVIRTADWIIDLGPEGGEEGGYVVAEGNPEAVAQVAGSYTGQFLQRVLQSYQGGTT